ncbi:MAG: hypothetical protein LC737_05970, partial [Chloroflexi bacterium]|nr:hypothetical protein [Chloroflexota bacterium]
IYSEGIAQRVWGQVLAARNLPEYAEAIAHFEKSLALLAEGDAVIEAARTHLAWGNVLMQCGEFERAREQFEKAAAQFEASGLRAELDHARQLIANVSVS